MARAQGRRHIFQIEWSYVFFHFGSLSRIPSYSPGQVIHTKNCLQFSFGKYEYIKVLFGLAQAPAYFQELMTGILKDFPFAMAYLDYIIIFSRTPQEHLTHIHMVFEKLRTANLSMKKSKCNFFLKEIQYLGHILSATSIPPLPSKTHAI